MSIKERKEITKMLVKVEVVILMMIFTIIVTHNATGWNRNVCG